MKLIKCLAFAAFVAPLVFWTTTTTVAAAATGGRMRRRRCKNLKMLPKGRCTRRPRSTPKPIPRIALPPTNVPTRKPTMFPTTPFPSNQPSHDPTSLPSSGPSSAPSDGPTSHPMAPPKLPNFCLGVRVTEYGGHLYGLYQTDFNWTAADAFFKSSVCCGTKGHLVTISDTHERVLVSSIATSQAWIGLAYVPMVNSFVWTTGEPYYSDIINPGGVSSNTNEYVLAIGSDEVLYLEFGVPTYTAQFSLFEFDCTP